MRTDDHSILRLVLAGDKNAYGALVVRHSQSVFRVAFRITGNEEDAEEAVQEAFLRGYQRLRDFESRSDFGTWIYRIAVNCSLDMVSARKVEAEYRVAEDADPDKKEVQVADSTAGPDRLLLSREINARHETAMKKLTPTERTAFVLRHMEGRSTDEIASVLGIAPNAAKQAVFRAVQKLRIGLGELRVSS